jgi:hypothetical protein
LGRIRVVSLVALAPVRCTTRGGDGRAHFHGLAEQRHSYRQRRIEHVWRRLYVVRLPAISRDAIDADFDFGRISKMGLFQVFGADVERCEFGIRRRGAKATLFHVFDLIIRYEVLRNAADGQ